MTILTEWELREFEIEDGLHKGQRGNEIKRVFRFQRFGDAISFMEEAKQGINILQHHPRWESVFRDVIVRLSSWDIGHRITDRDFILARYLDRLFRAYQKKARHHDKRTPL